MTFTGAFLSNGLPFVHHRSTWQIPCWGQTVSEKLGGPLGRNWTLATWLSFCASGRSSSVSKHPVPSQSNDCSCRRGHLGLQVGRRRASLGSALALQGGCACLEPCRFPATAQISEPDGCSLQRSRALGSPQNHRAGATLACEQLGRAFAYVGAARVSA